MWVCSRDHETYARIFKEKQQAPHELIELDCLKLDVLKALEPPVRINFLVNNINFKCAHGKVDGTVFI